MSPLLVNVHQPVLVIVLDLVCFIWEITAYMYRLCVYIYIHICMYVCMRDTHREKENTHNIPTVCMQVCVCVCV